MRQREDAREFVSIKVNAQWMIEGLGIMPDPILNGSESKFVRHLWPYGADVIANGGLQPLAGECMRA